MAGEYDPRDVSVIIDGITIPELQDIDYDSGETTEPANSSQGFVDHQVKQAAAVLKIKFKAAPHSAVLTYLGDLMRTRKQFTATVSTPELKATIVRCRLSGYPKRGTGISDMPDYDVELTGKAEDTRYE